VVAFRVLVPVADEDLAVASLWEIGTLGVQSKESAGTVELLAFFPEGTTLGVVREAVGGMVEPAAVPEVDWVARFREQFRAFSAGSFRVVPAWDIPADRDARTLVVDPGQAFGTGTHETTRLCLGWLETLAAERPLGRVLDYGCGTALLAIGALRLGATSAVGVDIDPDAIDNARDHVRLNGDPVELVLADGGSSLGAARFDTVVANVTGPLLRERRDEIGALCVPGGRIVLSGLLATEAEGLAAWYGALGPVRRRDDGEWAALSVDRV
jgi:ribosomal protein L11 methyltransferase